MNLICTALTGMLYCQIGRVLGSHLNLLLDSTFLPHSRVGLAFFQPKAE